MIIGVNSDNFSISITFSIADFADNIKSIAGVEVYSITDAVGLPEKE